MQFPGLGELTKDEELDWYYSQPIPVPVLGGLRCTIVVDGYAKDQKPEEFHRAISNFLSSSTDVLRAVENELFLFYKDHEYYWIEEGHEPIPEAADIWDRIQLGTQPVVSRRHYGDQGIYISLECECDWEPEHGLQIVFKDGMRVNKVGPFHGHVTNSDAFGDDGLEDVIYHSLYWRSSE